MDFRQYQEATKETAIYPKEIENSDIQSLVYVVLGLASESGELAGKLKKAIRDDGFLTIEKREAMGAELGDVLWYVARIADELCVDLNDISQQNIDKLFSRKERGVLKGSGDTR